MSIFHRLLGRKGASRNTYDAVAAYERHLNKKLGVHKGNHDLAYADAIGSESMALFQSQGDGHVAVLRHNGLTDGMAIYDLGCGSGRTAQALQRAGWQGTYTGADIIARFVKEMMAKSPGYHGVVNLKPTIVAADASLDMVFHWSVFTHLPPEECFLYLQDTWRALKPGGKLVFSFLEMTEPQHLRVFDSRVNRLAQGKELGLLDAFLHRDWIRHWAERIGFSEPQFTDGDDATAHPPFWQTLAAMDKLDR